MNGIERHIDIWDNCLHIIEQIVSPQQFNVWFKPIKAISVDGATLTVEVPSDFFREYLETAFLDVIRKTLKRVLGADAKLVYMIRPVTNQPPMSLPASTVSNVEGRTMEIQVQRPVESPSPFVYPGICKVPVNPRLNPVYCFENLVQGECNKMGLTAGINISESPGNTPFNPLFIFGGPGLGKTHLAQAIGLSILEKYQDKVVLYVTGNQFKTQYVDAVYVRNKLTDFLAFYMKIDVLIVDDIQDLLGQGTQTAFFNVFNHLHQMGKQLVFTSDRAPAELQNFEARLLSRFKWGLSVELKRPDYETRLSMLRARVKREGVTMSDQVLEYLASHITTNFRELEGAFLSVMAHATAFHMENSVELAAQVTEKIVGEVRGEITVDQVQDSVCDYFGISRDDLVSKSRRRQIVQARQIAIYICRNAVTNSSLSSIGLEFGKDHATVLHACTTVSDLMESDRTFKKYVNDIEAMLAPEIA